MQGLVSRGVPFPIHMLRLSSLKPEEEEWECLSLRGWQGIEGQDAWIDGNHHMGVSENGGTSFWGSL